MVKRSQLKVGMEVESWMMSGEWTRVVIDELPTDMTIPIKIHWGDTGLGWRFDSELRLLK